MNKNSIEYSIKKLTMIFGLIAIFGLVACNVSPAAATIATDEPTVAPVMATTAPAAPVSTKRPTAAAAPLPTETPTIAPTASAANADGTWRFAVTVAHPDTGWDDYADGWDVVLPDGSVVKVNPADRFTRLLAHPHETEQPFTRSQSGIRIPADVTTVTVRAHDLVDGWGGKTIAVNLTQATGDDFEVQK